MNDIINKLYRPVPSYVIANYFIDKSLEDAVFLNFLKIIKLVYISHGWRLAIENIPLISDRIEACRYGPSIPELYNYLTESKNNLEERVIYKIGPKNKLFNQAVHKDLLDDVWRIYKDFSSIQLANLCNNEKSAFHIVKREVSIETVISGPEIHNDIIRKHYIELLDKRMKNIEDYQI